MDATLPRLGVQLYTLRDEGDDLLAMVPKLAAMGYQGIELFGGQLVGLDLAHVQALLDEHGVVVASAHVGIGPDGVLDEGELDRLQAIGTSTVVVPVLWFDHFEDRDTVAGAAESLNRVAEQAAGRGLTLGYHNHWWELAPLDDDRPALLHLFEKVDPAVVAEVDVYWAHVGGVDEAELVAGLGDRVRLLHVKDGPGEDEKAAMVSVGSGALDIPAVLGANPAVEWHLVELDRCDTDMYEAVAESQRYLAGLGLSAVRTP